MNQRNRPSLTSAKKGGISDSKRQPPQSFFTMENEAVTFERQNHFPKKSKKNKIIKNKQPLLMDKLTKQLLEDYHTKTDYNNDLEDPNWNEYSGLARRTKNTKIPIRI